MIDHENHGVKEMGEEAEAIGNGLMIAIERFLYAEFQGDASLRARLSGRLRCVVYQEIKRRSVKRRRRDKKRLAIL